MIFITGASSGIGEACAHAFAAEKKNLFLVARRRDRLNQIKQTVEQKYGVSVHTRELDVCDPKAINNFATEEKDRLSRVEVLVNNAGLAKGLALIQDVTPEEWDAMIDTNIKGLLYTSKLVLPYFIARKSGHIVNLGSVAGHLVYPKGNIYSATKHAVHALNQAMRFDLQGNGIRVTEISPGMVETEFSEVRLGDKERAKSIYAGMSPLTAKDISEAIVWSVNRPAHVNIQEIVIYPTEQASVSTVTRRS